MSKSIFDQQALECGNCGTHFEASVCIALDSKDSAQLWNEILGGKKPNTFRCPREHGVEVVTPVLLHDAIRERLILCIDTSIPRDRVEKLANSVVMRFIQALAPDQREAALTTVETVTRDTLPEPLLEDPATTLRMRRSRMGKGVLLAWLRREVARSMETDPVRCIALCREALQILEEGDRSEAYDWFNARLTAALARQAAPEAPPPSPELSAMLKTFVQTPTWSAATEYLKTNGRVLLAADWQLAFSLLRAQYGNNPFAGLCFDTHDLFLRVSSAKGADEAFGQLNALLKVTLTMVEEVHAAKSDSEMKAFLQRYPAFAGWQPPDGSTGVAGRPQLDEVDASLLELVESFVNASWVEKGRLLNTRPELCDPNALRLFAAARAQCLQFGDLIAAIQVEEASEIVQQCALAGVAALDAEIAAPLKVDLLVKAAREQPIAPGADSLMAIDAKLAAWKSAQQALPATGVGRRVLSEILEGIAACLLRRYRQAGKDEDALTAVKFLESRPQARESAKCLTLLGCIARARFESRGDKDDLLKSIESLKSAVRLTPQDSCMLATRLGELANSLQLKHVRAGDVDDLNAAITLNEQALNAASPFERVAIMASLAGALLQRHRSAGGQNDLERAIGVLREASQGMPANADTKPEILNNLGIALALRAELFRSGADLDESIDSFRTGIQSCPPGSRTYRQLLLNLGNALKQRFDDRNDPTDLNEAIEFYTHVRDLLSANDPDLPLCLSNLGSALTRRFDIGGVREDLDLGVNILEEAVASIPPTSPYAPIIFNVLGVALRRRFDLKGNVEDRRRAIEQYRSAVRAGLRSAPTSSLTTVRNWAYWAMDRQSWVEASESFSFGMLALNTLYRQQALGRAKQRVLEGFRGLPAHAAYAHAMSGDLRRAVMTLERGRALLLSESLERGRIEAELLTDARFKTLYARYQAALIRVANVDALIRPDLEEGNDQGLLAQAQADLANIEGEIREVAGLADFNYWPIYSDIRDALADAVLVYLAATRAGGMALIVGLGQPDEIKLVWLPKLTENALRDRSQRYLGAYAARHAEALDWTECLEQTTRWLWDVIMGELVDAVQGIQKLAIVCFSTLTLLPLHAAWREDATSPGGREYVLDHLAIHYVPNARALAAARNAAQHNPPEKALIAEVPMCPGCEFLRYTGCERESVIQAFPSHEVLDAKASPATLNRALPEYDVFHFAGHAFADLQEPMRSGLLLLDGTVFSLADFMRLRIRRMRLAVLSACETSLPGLQLPDEVLSLPSGLLGAGAAAVIASMWAVTDLSTFLLLHRYYDLWPRQESDGVEALRQAQLWLRKATNKEIREYLVMREAPDEMDNPAASKLMMRAAKHLDTVDPEAQGFSSCRFWAAFTYFGV